MGGMNMTESEKIDLLLQAVTGIQADMQEVKADVQGLKTDMQEVKSDVQGLKADVSELKRKVSVIELTLENEISHNIMVIAEGHLDLNRKLDEAIHLTSDIKAKQEIQDLYIRRHDNKLRTKGIS